MATVAHPTPGSFLALNKAVADFLTPALGQSDAVLDISYDRACNCACVELWKAFSDCHDCDSEPAGAERSPTATEFFERICVVAEGVPQLRDFATTAVIKCSPEAGSVSVDLLHNIACSLFPSAGQSSGDPESASVAFNLSRAANSHTGTIGANLPSSEEQALRSLVLDNVAPHPSKHAVSNAYPVRIDQLRICNSPALFEQPVLLEQLLTASVFGEIKELYLIDVPLHLLHGVVRALFPAGSAKRKLHNLVLDNIVIDPREPIVEAEDVVNIDTLHIHDSPALFAEPELARRALSIFVEIGKLNLVCGDEVINGVDACGDAHSRTLTTQKKAKVQEMFIEGPNYDCSKKLAKAFVRHVIALPISNASEAEDMGTGDVEETRVISEKFSSSQESPSPVVIPMLEGIIASPESVLNVKFRVFAKNACVS